MINYPARECAELAPGRAAGKGRPPREGGLVQAAEGGEAALLLPTPALRSRRQRPRLRRAAARAPQELTALIKYIQLNKASDSDWFTITSNKEGTHWSGKCWYVHNLLRHEFAFEFDIPATYPATAPEIRIPELDGKTAKMYRGGAICLTVHFKPLWAKNRRVRAAAHTVSYKSLCCQTCIAWQIQSGVAPHCPFLS